MTGQRIGVLGGTFDPVHLGHLRAAESVREAMALDRVLFVPAYVPPHKARPSLSSAEDRFRMVKAAVRHDPALAVSRVEIEREGPSYTIDTLNELARTDFDGDPMEHARVAETRPSHGGPDADGERSGDGRRKRDEPSSGGRAKVAEEKRLFFITGIDAFRDIRTWKRWEALLESFSFIVHGRPGYGLAGAYETVPDSLRVRLVELRSGAAPPPDRGPAIYLVHALTLNISATEIRAMVRAGRSIRYLVPVEVESYIYEHRLYKEGA